MNIFKGFLFLLGFCTSTIVAGSIEDHFSLFTEITTHEMVRSVDQFKDGELEVNLQDTLNNVYRDVKITADSRPLEQLIARSVAANISFSDHRVSNSDSLSQGQPATLVEARTISGSRKNKVSYVLAQTFYSSYIIGGALPNLLGLEDKSGAFLLLGIPSSFGYHLYSAWDRPIHDATLDATTYYPLMGAGLSYLLPYTLAGDIGEDGLRVGSFLSLLAYPAGLWYGHKEGERLASNPGRMGLTSNLGYTGALAGLLGGLAMSEGREDRKGYNPDAEIRMITGGVLLGAMGGHFGSTLYRKGETIPEGVPGGILNHSLLGLAATMAIAVQSNSEGNFPMVAFAGLSLGTTSGLFFHRNARDSYERAWYDRLGMLGGATFALGIMALAENDEEKQVVPAAVVGAFAGYAITRYFTRNLLDSGSERLSSFEFNPIPIYELAQSSDNSWHGRYRIPGFNLRF
jgi:hypothetical protein